MTSRFRDRMEAGQLLAEKLASYKERRNAYVFALPRGGVPVAYQVARALHLPLDIFTVRKLGAPGQPELALGAIASGGVRVLNQEIVDALAIPKAEIDAISEKEQQELNRQEQFYRGNRSPLDPRGGTIILVDDGLATGASMRAAVKALKERGCAGIVVAVPIAASETCESLESEVDEIVCARTPEPFEAVGLWYEDFSQTSDQEVRDLLWRAGQLRSIEP